MPGRQTRSEVENNTRALADGIGYCASRQPLGNRYAKIRNYIFEKRFVPFNFNLEFGINVILIKNLVVKSTLQT